MTRSGFWSRRKRTASLGLAAVAAVSLASCTASGSGTGSTLTDAPSASASHQPVTLQMYSFFTGREAAAVNHTLTLLHKAYPWLTVHQVQGKKDPDVLQAVNSGQPPDLAILQGPNNVAKFCHDGVFQDLGPVIKSSGLDLTGTFAAGALSFSGYQGTQCSLPWLADAFGIYYNKPMLKKAGFSGPPKTYSQLLTMEKKLTTYNSDGSIKVAGFVPLSTFYETPEIYQGFYSGAHWYSGGKSAMASDPAWASLANWDKKWVDALGYAKLVKFAASLGADSEFATTNGFEKGKIAMMIDGEWRPAFMKADKATVDYGIAPFPVDDQHTDLYGSSITGGVPIGIPKGTKNAAAAWIALKWLTTNYQANDDLSEAIQNVPTQKTVLASGSFAKGATGSIFAKMVQNPKTATKDLSTAGSADLDLWLAFLGKVEAGKATVDKQSLGQLAKNIDQQVKAS